MPGERIPLDGTVLTGESQIDTAALTGESVPRTARPGDEVISGCVNLTAKLVVRATKPFEDSTVSRILELVENAAEKKARTENFITRFARVYTPIVVGVAAVLAIVPRCCSVVSGPTGSCADSPSSWCRAPARWSSLCRCRSSAASAAPRASASS